MPIFCKKDQKNKEDLNVIKEFFLHNIQFFKNLPGKISTEILDNIAKHLKYERIKKNRIIHKTGYFYIILGNRAKRFFFILQGGISLLIPEEKKVSLTEKEYLQYLYKLRKYKENELILKLLILNKGIFHLEETLEHWLKGESNYYISENTKSHRNEYLNNIFSNVEGKFGEYNMEYDKLYDIVPVDEYIDRIRINPSGLGEDRRTVIIIEYYLLKTFSLGENIGELYTKTFKRVNTIITSENTHLAILTIEEYEKHIKEIIERNDQANFNFLFSSSIFNGVDKHDMFKKYYNYFSFCKIDQNKTLFVENSPSENVYFIKSGEFLLSIRKNMNELDDLIMIYGGREKLRKLKWQKTENSYNSKFFKMLIEKQIFHFSIIQEGEIIGLDDIIVQEKYVFTFDCVSKAEYFKINRKIFNRLIIENGIICKNLEKYLQMKREYILNRLINLKISKLDYFDMFHSNKSKGESMLENFKTSKPSNIRGFLSKKDNISTSDIKKNNYSLDINTTKSKSYFNRIKKGKDNISHVLDTSKPVNVGNINRDNAKTPMRISLWDKSGRSKGNFFKKFSSGINLSDESISSKDEDPIKIKPKLLKDNFKVMNVAVETDNAKSSEKKEFMISKIDCLAMDNINIIKNSLDPTITNYLDKKFRPKSFTKINVKKPLPMILFRKERKKLLSKVNNSKKEHSFAKTKRDLNVLNQSKLVI